MLEVRQITKVYNPGASTELRLFENFSLSVPDGQFVSIVGSNGSGKTSLLNIICGSIPVEAGDILAGLRPLSVRGHRDPAIGMPLKPAGKIKL